MPPAPPARSLEGAWAALHTDTELNVKATLPSIILTREGPSLGSMQRCTPPTVNSRNDAFPQPERLIVPSQQVASVM